MISFGAEFPDNFIMPSQGGNTLPRMEIHLTNQSESPNDQPLITSGTSRSATLPHNRPRVRGIRSAIVALLLLAVSMPIAIYGVVMQAGWLHKPYSSVLKPLAWVLGHHESAYNFDEVIPNRCYRSGMPDARMLGYIKGTYGIAHIVSLKGERECHAIAREMGMKVTTMSWGTGRAPPRSELLQVLKIIQQDEPVLIHCSVGKHRTGYAVAAYRILHQKWTYEQAFRDMVEHGYLHNDRPAFEESLQTFSANPQESL